MEKIEQQMEDDQLGQQMVATPMPNKSKPYTQDSANQKTKIINQHLKPTRYAYHHRLVIHAQDNTYTSSVSSLREETMQYVHFTCMVVLVEL